MIFSKAPVFVVASVELLTRVNGEPYDEYVRRIATATGRCGELARTVKRDAHDNLSRSLEQGHGNRIAKYERVLAQLGPVEGYG